MKQNHMVAEDPQRNIGSPWILTALAAEVLWALETGCVEEKKGGSTPWDIGKMKVLDI